MRTNFTVEEVPGLQRVSKAFATEELSTCVTRNRILRVKTYDTIFSNGLQRLIENLSKAQIIFFIVHTCTAM
jgi:hypothetical protein